MYFYLTMSGKLCRNLHKTIGVENAQILIDVSFDDDCNFVITNIRRIAGTELSKLLKTIQFAVDDARRIGCPKVICNTNKVPSCYLRKIGFENNELIVSEYCADLAKP